MFRRLPSGLLVIVAIVLPLTTSGCGRSSRTTKTTTYSDSPGYYSDTTAASQKTVTETESSSKSSSDCGGVLSCTVHTLGVVIAYTFRLVGGLFEALF